VEILFPFPLAPFLFSSPPFSFSFLPLFSSSPASHFRAELLFLALCVEDPADRAGSWCAYLSGHLVVDCTRTWKRNEYLMRDARVACHLRRGNCDFNI